MPSKRNENHKRERTSHTGREKFPPSRCKVLVADPQISHCQLVSYFFAQTLHFQVCDRVALSAGDVIRFAEEFRPALLVTEIFFRGSTRCDLITEVQAKSPATRVVVFTGSTKPALLAAVLSTAPDGFVLKSEPIEQLEKAVGHATEGERFVSTAVIDLAWNPNGAPGAEAAITAREDILIRGIVEGRATKEIAVSLGCAPRTAERHRSALMRKFGFSDVPSLVRFAIASGILECKHRSE